MKSFKDIKFFIGPMSLNIVDSIIEYCNRNDLRMGLIPSRRQIEYTQGYVNNWSTEEFAKYVKSRSSNVVLQRDHGGRAQGGEDYKASYRADVKAGFDLIHIDPWKEFTTLDEIIEETIENILFCYDLNPAVCYEVGTEEAIHKYSATELDYFLGQLQVQLPSDAWKQIKYGVIQAGTRISGIKNLGVFDTDRCKRMIAVCRKYNILSKEHNGDYLTLEGIQQRFDIGLDAINIAPEFGVLETKTILQYISPGDFEALFSACKKSKKWVKWVPPNYIPEENKEELVMICGHYVFSSETMINIKKNTPLVQNAIKNKITEYIRILTTQEKELVIMKPTQTNTIENIVKMSHDKVALYNKFFKKYFCYLGDNRNKTFYLALKLILTRGLKTIVETGTTRKNTPLAWIGDGCSTILYGDFCHTFNDDKNPYHIWTCDISQDNIELCKKYTQKYKDFITYIVDDSIDFLTKFDSSIDFLYLDSFDALPGLDIEASQHNLKELTIAINKLHKNSVILLDDSRINGEKQGKGIFSIPYLKENGWLLLNENWGIPPYQALFVREDSITK